MKYYVLIAALVASINFSCGNAQELNSNSNTLEDVRRDSSESIGHDNVIAEYINLKNALASDDSKTSAVVGKRLRTAIINLGKESMSDEQKEAYSDIGESIKEHAEHITDNNGNIEHQREHLEDLSVDLFDLIEIFGTSKTLYKNFCPMKKVSWLSESEEIRNPYYGKSMLTCGNIQEVINRR